MAAEHFFDGGESCVRKTLHAIAAYPYWRNVFLFAAGRVFFQRQELIDSIIAVCGEMNDHPDDPAQRTIFAGSRLALAILKDGAARNQPASIRVLARYAARALDAWDEEAATSFGETFSGEAEEVWKEELSKRLITSGPIFPHHNWLLCLQLVGMNKPWARDLMTRWFPWKGKDAHEFIVQADRSANRPPEAFWQEMTRNIYSHSPATFWQVLWPDDAATACLRCGPLNQFAPLLNPRAPAEERWPLEGAVGFSIQARGAHCRKMWAGLQYPEAGLHNAHPEWQVCQAVSAFAQMPTKSNLGKQLSAISQLDLDWGMELQWSFPWQIVVCLMARESGYTWSEIISSVVTGRLGTEVDWLRWEERNEKGVPLSRFRVADVLSVTDDRQGVLFRKSGWIFSAGENQTIQFAVELAVALNQYPDIRSEGLLLEFCAFGLDKVSGPSTGFQRALVQLVGVCAEHNIAITPPLVSAILQSALPTNDRCDLLGKAGACPVERGWLSDWQMRVHKLNMQLDALVTDLSSYQDRCNLLRAVSFLPPVDALQKIPDALLVELRGKGGKFLKAAIVLQLNGLRWNESEVGHLVAEALAAKNDYPEHLDRLFDFIESGGKSGPHLEVLFVEFLRQLLPEQGARMLRRATAILVKLLERRPALNTLPDPAILGNQAAAAGVF